MDRNQFQVPTIWSQLGYVLPRMRKMIDAWHVHSHVHFTFNCSREEKEVMGEPQKGYVQLIPAVDYSLEHTEVLFSPVEKHRLD